MLAQKLMDGLIATYAYCSSTSTNSAATTYTFSSLSLGTAATSRKIMVFAAGANNASLSISSVTVAGVSASELLSGSFGASPITGGVWIADVPTGTTGDVVVTWSASQDQCGVGVYALYNVSSSTPYDTDSFSGGATSGATSVTVNYSGGFFLGFVANQNNSVTGYSWTNVTEDFDISIAGGAGRYMSGASSVASGSGSVTMTATAAGATTQSTIMFGLSFN